MQKVEGSSPFIRFQEPAANGGFFVDALRDWGGLTTVLAAVRRLRLVDAAVAAA
jgi:hypothetical protein